MGKSLNYSKLIREDCERLSHLIRKESDSINRDRLRFLLLLKSGTVKSQAAAGKEINLGERQSQNLWRKYKMGGLKGLMHQSKSGAPCKLTDEQLSAMQERLKEDDIQFLDEASALIEKEYGQTYTRSGVFRLFQRLKIKKKTGRPVNIRQDQAGMDTFKKTSGT